jgi:hypothetical protein
MLSIRDQQQTRDDAAARHLLITPCGDRIVLMGEAGDFLLGPEGGAMLHRQAEREDAHATAAEREHEAAAAASLQKYLAGAYEVISVRPAGTPRSDCCSCRPAFELTPGDPTGLCAQCGEHASFSALD